MSAPDPTPCGSPWPEPEPETSNGLRPEPVTVLVSTAFLGLGGGVYRLWMTTIEAVENATKKVVMTVETTAGAASRLILVLSSAAEDILMAVTDEVVDLICLIARLPKQTAAGMSLFMRVLVDRAAVIGLTLFTLLYAALMIHDGRHTAWLENLRQAAEAVPLGVEPSEDVLEYCPLCEAITSSSDRYCPICSSRLPPAVLRPRTDRPKWPPCGGSAARYGSCLAVSSSKET